MDIAKNIKEIRLQKSINQQQIANALKVDVAVVSNIEKGKRELKAKELETISRVLEISVVDLITYPKQYVEKNSIDEQQAAPKESCEHERLRHTDKNFSDLIAVNKELAKQNGILIDIIHRQAELLGRTPGNTAPTDSSV